MAASGSIVRRRVVGPVRRAQPRALDARRLPMGLGAPRPATVGQSPAPRRDAAHGRALPRGTRGERRGRRDDPQDPDHAPERLPASRRVAAARGQPGAGSAQATGWAGRERCRPSARRSSRRCERICGRAAASATRRLIVLLAYAGLRPGEALGLEWRHVRERTLLVEQAVSDGQLKGLKNRRRPRAVRLLAPLRDDLEPARTSGPVFARADGGLWRETDWRNWRRRVFRPAAARAGLVGARPYDLRHAFASLLIAEGRLSIVEIAAQLRPQPDRVPGHLRARDGRAGGYGRVLRGPDLGGESSGRQAV